MSDRVDEKKVSILGKITNSAPPVAPYVRVSYTALHLYDNFRLT